MANSRTKPTLIGGSCAGRRYLIWLGTVFFAAALSAGNSAHAQTGSSGADLSFDQLTSIEVSGVSKAAERVLDAPAAVTVITGEEIRNFGFRTLADVLNTAPGFFTYSDRAYSYVGIRGFAPIESYNSRVLLLIDGVPTNDSVYQQAMIGYEAIIDLTLVDRIEIIPGPSSSVYGNNAFLGVINVILKNPSQVNSSAQAWLGAGVEHGTSLTYSGGDGADTHYLLQVTGSGSEGLDVVFNPQPGLPQGARVSGMDGTDVTRAFAKIIHENFRVDLAFSERRQHTGYGLYGDVIGDPRSWVRDGESFADLHYEGSFDETTDYVLRATAAEYRYDTDTVDSYPNIGALPGFLPAVGDWFDAEATGTHHFSATNRLVFGSEVRRNQREEMTFTNDLQGTFLRVSNADTLAGIYAQSDIDWSAQWATSLGLRDDANSGQANRVSPRVAILWKPTATQAFKLLSGSAYREPSFFERFFAQPPLNLPNLNLVPERVRTLDLNYENQISATSRLSLTVFRYRTIDLISENVVNPALGSVQYQNNSSEQARGFDLLLEGRVLADLRARLSTEYAFAYDAAGNWEQNSPLWTGRLGMDQGLPADLRVGAEALFEGRRLAIDNTALPAVVVANCTLSRAPHPGRVDFSLGVYNLFGRNYAQPVAAWQGDSVNQLGRNWRATVGYSF